MVTYVVQLNVEAWQAPQALASWAMTASVNERNSACRIIMTYIIEDRVAPQLVGLLWGWDWVAINSEASQLGEGRICRFD